MLTLLNAVRTYWKGLGNDCKWNRNRFGEFGKPLLLVSEEDELLFQQLIQPTIEQELIQCQLALSTRKSISLIKDIWLAMYRDREKLYINSGHAMLYPIRLLLLN